MPGSPPTWNSSRPSGPLSGRPRFRGGSVRLEAPVPLLGSAPPQGFSQAFILSVSPPVQIGTELFLSWTSNAPAGLVFQVYLNRQLIWTGSGTAASIPLPSVPASRIDIGTVGLANRYISYAGSLPGAPQRVAELSWLGGTYEGADIAGFHVYGEHSPGAGIDYTAILGTVPAYIAGIITDGFGYGGFGQGGFGEAAGFYSWTSGPLASGTWQWGVSPYDQAGNEGTVQVTAVGITAPPLPPASFPDRTRLHYAYSPGSKKVTLSWNASPG
jgi:hypothetical protein